MTEPTLSEILSMSLNDSFSETLNGHVEYRHDADSGVLSVSLDTDEAEDIAHDLVSVEKLLTTLANLDLATVAPAVNGSYMFSTRREIWRSLLLEKLDATTFRD